jgi:hypothetical protein
MPDSRISALPSATSPLAGTEVLPIVQSGTTDKVTAADLLRQSGQTVTTSNPVLSLAQTWNAGGVTFTADLINITDTASAAASRLIARQVGGVDKFVVLKTGATQIGGAAPAGAANVSAIQAFGSSFALVGAAVTTDAADKAMRIAGLHYLAAEEPVGALFTYSSTSASLVAIGGGSSSMNAVTQVDIYTAANTTTTTGTSRWQWNSAGHFLAATDNTYDIGASGATRPRTVYAGTSFVAPDGSDASPSFTFGTSQTGIYRDSGGGRMRFAIGGNFAADLGINSFGVRSDTGTLTFGNTGDVILARDAANTLAQRNGTNTQTFNLYKTYTDASNYERLSMFSAGGSEFTFVTQRAGAGAAMNLTLGTYGNAILSFMTGGSTKWQITTSGHLVAATDNTYDIGASGATRPRTVYAATSFISGNAVVAGSAGSFQFANRTILQCPSDGVLTLQNNAASDFSRLQFGGTTSSFPSLRRSGTQLLLRLADDSGYAGFICSSLEATSTGTFASTVAIPAGGTDGVGIRVSSTGNFGVFFGSGAPTLSAAKGSLYLRSDGSGIADRMYVNTNGSTTWTAVATVA